MKITKFQTTILSLTLIGIVTIICYWNCLWFDFVFDDYATIKYSPVIKNPQTLVDILTLKILTKDVLDNVRPMTVLSTWIDFQIWKEQPFGYHLTNLILHCLCSFLVYFFAINSFSSIDRFSEKNDSIGAQSILAGRNLAALTTALLFAIHPVHSEAVCGISYRDDLLCTLFFLIAFILFQKIITKKLSLATAFPAAVILFFSGLSKEMAFSFPFVLIFFVILAGTNKESAPGVPHWKLPSAFIPVILSILIFGLLYYLCFIHAKRDITLFAGYKPDYLGGSFWRTVPASFKIGAFYLVKLIWPANLSPDYPVRNLLAFSSAGSLVLGGIVVLIACLQFRSNPAAFFGLSFFYITLVPVSNLVPLFRPVADRYLYLPSIGWCLFLVSTLRYSIFKMRSLPANSTRKKRKEVRRKTRRKNNSIPALKKTLPSAILLIFCIYLITLSDMTIKQNRIWKDSLSFWSYAVKVNPTSSIALNNLAYAHLDAGEYEKALNVWEKFLIKFGAKAPDALAGLAVALYRNGRQKEALIMFRKAAHMDPSYGKPELLETFHFWNPDWIRDVERLMEDSR